MRPRLPPIYLIMITALFHEAVNAAETRFVPLDQMGRPLTAKSLQQRQEWPCIFDQRTGLTWEGKTQAKGLHHRHNTFNWFDTNHTRNGGLAGEPAYQECREAAPQSICDTQRFINAVNEEGLCNAHDWRLPHREELRSLVDYRVPYPGPATDTQAFPNALAQFYWSADANARAPREAWGIGFAFGFDYAYFKNDRVHVRLVHGQPQDSPQK